MLSIERNELSGNIAGELHIGIQGPPGKDGSSTTISLRYGISSEPMENTVVVWQDTIPQMSETYPYLWIEISTETKTATGGSIVIEKGIIGYYSTPGSGGNVDLTGVVKSVNGISPDEKGNVQINTGGGASLMIVEVEGDRASHTAEEIYNHVQSGGAVIAKSSLYVFTLDRLNDYYANFVNVSGTRIASLSVDVYGAVTVTNTQYAKDYTLPIGGEQLGGVKNGGNVTINADGTMTAPESEVTEEQIEQVVDSYLKENPVSGGGSEKWETVADITTEAETASINLDAGEGKAFKKVKVLVDTGSVGLSTAAKIELRADNTNKLNSNNDIMGATPSTINTWASPLFLLESGNGNFPVCFVAVGGATGAHVSAVQIGGVAASYKIPGGGNNAGPWRYLKMAPQNGATFNAGVKVYVWGVYE